MKTNSWKKNSEQGRVSVSWYETNKQPLLSAPQTNQLPFTGIISGCLTLFIQMLTWIIIWASIPSYTCSTWGYSSPWFSAAIKVQCYLEPSPSGRPWSPQKHRGLSVKMETAQIAFSLHNISGGLRTSLFCSCSQVCSLFPSYLLFVWWPLLGVKNCVGEFGGRGCSSRESQIAGCSTSWAWQPFTLPQEAAEGPKQG